METLNSVVALVHVKHLQQLLVKSKYNAKETKFLIDGFTNGFDIEYQGKENRQDSAKNIPFQAGVGNSTEMWQKIMKEVDAGRYAGPLDAPPFEHFVQSPIGLVPKAND